MENFTGGLILMVVGMTVVFLFLALMVILMGVMSSVLNKYFPETVVVTPIKLATSTKGGGEIAAITTAVHQYIRSKK